MEAVIFVCIYKQHPYVNIMSPFLGKWKNKSAYSVKEAWLSLSKGHAALPGDYDSHSVWVVTFDQELLLQLLAVTFSFQVELEIDR